MSGSGGHQPARRVRLVGQQAPHRFGLVRIHRAQQLVAALRRQLAQQVGGVVGLHLVQDARQPLPVEALDETDLLILGELLQKVRQPLVLERRGQHPASTQRQLAQLARHLRGMQLTEGRRLPTERTLVREQLAGLAPIDHLGPPSQPRQPRGPGRWPLRLPGRRPEVRCDHLGTARRSESPKPSRRQRSPQSRRVRHPSVS